MRTPRLISRLAAVLATAALATVAAVAPAAQPAEAAPTHHRPGVEGLNKLFDWTDFTHQSRLDDTWNAYAKAGEVINATAYVGFRVAYQVPDPAGAGQPAAPQVRVRIIDPAGATVASCVANGLRSSCQTSATAKTTGVYKAVWDCLNLYPGGAQVFYRQDVWVMDGTQDKTGRVFTERMTAEQDGAWHFIDPQTFDERGAVEELVLYVLGDDGTLLRLDQRGFMGISSGFHADSVGVFEVGTCLPINRSTHSRGDFGLPKYASQMTADGDCGRSFLIFPDRPATDLPESLTAGSGWEGPLYPRYQPPAQPRIGEVKNLGQQDRPFALEAQLYLGDFKGIYRMGIDINRDGDLQDTEDVVVNLQKLTTSEAPITWQWDGNDGNGQPVPSSAGELELEVQLMSGNEYHLLSGDIEDLAGGVRIQQLAGYLVDRAGGQAVWPNLHWDDTDIQKHSALGPSPERSLTTEPKLVKTPPEGVVQNGDYHHGWKSEVLNGQQLSWGDNAIVSMDIKSDLSGDAQLRARVGLAARELQVASKTGVLSAPQDGARRIQYEVTIKNAGTADFTVAEPARIEDQLPAHVTDWRYEASSFDAGTASGLAAVAIQDGKLSWAAPLKGGETARIRYSGAVEPGYAAVRLNTVSAGECAEDQTAGGSVLFSICDDQPVEAEVKLPGLAVAKSVLTKGLHRPGDFAEYKVTVTNIGQAPYTAADPARVTDSLGAVLDDAALDVASLRPSSATWNAASQTLSWSGPLAVGASQEITYRVQYSPGLAAGSDRWLHNVAQIAPEDEIDLTPGIRAETTTPGSDLHVLKTADAESVEAGQSLSYSVQLDNSLGKAPAPVDWFDNLTDVLDDARLDGAPSVSSATVDAAITGQGIQLTGQVPAGGKVTVTYSVTVKASGGDRVLRNHLEGACQDGQCPPPADCAPDNPLATCTPVLGYEVAKEALVPNPDVPPAPGDLVEYRLTFTNTGGAPVSVAEVDNLGGVLDDAQFVHLNLDDSRGLSAELDGDQLRIAGTLPLGEPAVITYLVGVKAAEQLGDSRLINVVEPAGVITDTPIGAFMVLKTAIPAVAHPGDVVSYQIDLVSTGAAPVEVDLVDYLAWVLDDSEIVEEPQINEATIDVAHARRSPIIGVMGELDSGSEATLEYKVRVPEDADGDDLMVNVVIEPLSAMALPEERPECGAFAEGSCTTTPVIWPETALPVTGSGSVWPVTTAALVALLGGCGFLVARRVKLRHR